MRRLGSYRETRGDGETKQRDRSGEFAALLEGRKAEEFILTKVRPETLGLRIYIYTPWTDLFSSLFWAWPSIKDWAC